jgi:hypothetical protein
MGTHAVIAGRMAAKDEEGHKRPFPLTVPALIALLALTAILLHLALRYLFNVPHIAWQAPLISGPDCGWLAHCRAFDTKALSR